jgi:hypothetical protein
MVAKEQLMSQAKRDHSAFHQSVAVGRAIARIKRTGPVRVAPNSQNLRVLESWENKAIPSGDPYNGIGARAVTGHGLRK